MDSANIAGKSVEMISNSLAEMRTYGEGFIIADQSPEQMDLSVIRNTNTKIIMRLPFYEDRKLVGKSASMNEAQIDEISKFPTGIAAVFQNDWMDPVLVKIPYYGAPKDRYHFQWNYTMRNTESDDETTLLYAMMFHIRGLNTFISNLGINAVNIISKMHVSTAIKRQLIKYVKVTDKESRIDIYQEIAFLLFNAQEVMELTSNDTTLAEWKYDAENLLEPSIVEFKEWGKNLLLWSLCRKFTAIDSSFSPILEEMSQLINNKWKEIG